MVHTWDKLFEMADGLDWHATYEAKDLGELYEVDFAKYSPAGEDFSFYCEADTPEDLVEKIYENYADFDVDEHVKLVMGMRGAPGLKELVEDAEAIKEMIWNLYDVLSDYKGDISSDNFDEE